MAIHGETLTSLADMLRTHLGDLLAPADSFVDMFAENGAMEFPFAPDGIGETLVGKQALSAHFKRIGGMLSISAMKDVEVHRGNDDTVVIEFSCDGTAIPTGRPYPQRYVSVIRLQDGKIVRYRDYWNPLVVNAAFEGVTF